MSNVSVDFIGKEVTIITSTGRTYPNIYVMKMDRYWLVGRTTNNGIDYYGKTLYFNRMDISNVRFEEKEKEL